MSSPPWVRASGAYDGEMVDASTDIRQIPGRFEARITLLTGLGNGKSPSPRAKGHRSWWLTAARR
jgi:hypothetical protein